jgi:hypothetical protein
MMSMKNNWFGIVVSVAALALAGVAFASNRGERVVTRIVDHEISVPSAAPVVSAHRLLQDGGLSTAYAPHGEGPEEDSAEVNVPEPTISELRAEARTRVEMLRSHVQASMSTRVARLRETELADAFVQISAEHSVDVETVQCSDDLCLVEMRASSTEERDAIFQSLLALPLGTGEAYLAYNLSDEPQFGPELNQIFIAEPGSRLPIPVGDAP